MKPLAAFAIAATFAAAAIAQPFTISTIAGAGTQPVPALNASINNPQALAADTAGNIYFITNSAVYKLDQSGGTVTHIAGINAAGYSGDGGPAISAQLDGPTALAIDPAGNLYIAEGGGHIRKVDVNGIITTIAGNGVCHGGCFTDGAGDGGPATSAELFYPWQIAADAVGNVYIGEWNTLRIRKISPDGIITTIAGNGTSGDSGDGGPAIDAGIGAPWGFAFDRAGNLYFSDDTPGCDYAPDAVRVRKISAEGIITAVAGYGAPGGIADSGDGGPAINAQFIVAGSLAVDNAGDLYISDFNRIRKVSPDSTIATFAGTGQPGYAGDGGPAGAAQFNGSFYGPPLAADAIGNLYVGDTYNNRIREISPAGIVATVAGSGIGCCYSGDGGPAVYAQLYVPTGIAVDNAGTIYVADTYNNRIRKIDPTGVITTFAGTGLPLLPSSSGDGGPATSAGLAWPTGLKLDGSGNIYFADAGNMRVRKISGEGIITTVAGNGTADYTGDGGAATSASLNWPKDIAFDGVGNLYIADTANNAIRTVASDGSIQTIGIGPLNQPSGVAIDSTGNLYVADTGNFRVVRMNEIGIVTTVAGNGSQGYSGDGGAGAAAQLQNPTGLAFDRAGNLFIGDGAAVRMVSPDGVITTVAGTGVVGFTGDGGPATSAQTGAWGLAFDSTGRLYLSDPWNGAIRLLW